MAAVIRLAAGRVVLALVTVVRAIPARRLLVIATEKQRLGDEVKLAVQRELREEMDIRRALCGNQTGLCGCGPADESEVCVTQPDRIQQPDEAL